MECVLEASYFFFFFLEWANTEPAKLLMPLGDFIFRSSPETLFAVLKLERALLTFVFIVPCSPQRAQELKKSEVPCLYRKSIT